MGMSVLAGESFGLSSIGNALTEQLPWLPLILKKVQLVSSLSAAISAAAPSSPASLSFAISTQVQGQALFKRPSHGL